MSWVRHGHSSAGVPNGDPGRPWVSHPPSSDESSPGTRRRRGQPVGVAWPRGRDVRGDLRDLRFHRGCLESDEPGLGASRTARKVGAPLGLLLIGAVELVLWLRRLQSTGHDQSSGRP